MKKHDKLTPGGPGFHPLTLGHSDVLLIMTGWWTTGMVGLAPKRVRLAPNGTNPGLFQIRFQCIWRRGAKCTEIWSEKAPDLSHLGPIWPALEPNLPSLVLGACLCTAFLGWRYTSLGILVYTLNFTSTSYTFLLLFLLLDSIDLKQIVLLLWKINESVPIDWEPFNTGAIDECIHNAGNVNHFMLRVKQLNAAVSFM